MTVRLLFILLLSAFSSFLFSQQDTSKQKIFFGINAGLNFSKIRSDTIPFSYGTKPQIGFFANYNFSKRFSIKSSVHYSIKGSTSSFPHYIKFENHYLDINIIPRLNFSKDFYFHAGVNYSHFLSASIIHVSRDTAIGGIIREDNGKFKSEINIISGLEFRLQDNVNLQFNYFIPPAKNNTTNFQLSLNVVFNDKKNKKTHPIREKRNRAKEEIAQLKNGVLLVRLKSSENKINTLLKMGETEKANKIKQEQEKENRKIIFAFRHHYDFSNVLFFYNNQSIHIRNKKFEKIFLNDSLTVDSSIILDKSKPIFIAEFAPIEKDTVKYYLNSSYEPDGDFSLKDVKHFYGGPDFGFEALIIKNEKFVQLNKPFPYYTRAIFKSIKEHPEEAIFLAPILLVQNWSYNKTVGQMNEKLHAYYEKVIGNK